MGRCALLSIQFTGFFFVGVKTIEMFKAGNEGIGWFGMFVSISILLYFIKCVAELLED